MCQMLREDETDMAVILTEGIIKIFVMVIQAVLFKHMLKVRCLGVSMWVHNRI